MKLVYPMFILFAVFLLFLYLPVYSGFTDALEKDYEQYRLDKAVELSTRAAAQTGLTYGIVRVEYDQVSEIEYNAKVAIDTFAAFMCLNYNLPATEANREYILSKSTLLMAGGRGFYVTQNEDGDYYFDADGKLSRGAFSYVFKNPSKPEEGLTRSTHVAGTRTIAGPFTPYTVTVDAVTYAVGLLDGDTFAPGFDASSISAQWLRGDTLPAGITREDVFREASSQISRALIQSWLQRSTIGAASYNRKIALPSSATRLGVNPIVEPTVIAVVDGIKLNTYRALRSEVFTAYKATLSREVAAFVEKSGGKAVKYYCYIDRYRLSGADKNPDYELIQIYPSMKDAADAGYLPHLDFLSK